MSQDKGGKAPKFGRKRTEQQIEHDLLVTGDLMTKGYSVRQITSHLNQKNIPAGYTLSLPQVHSDMGKVIDLWKEDRASLIDNYVARELQKLRKMEQECWHAWENSKKGKSRTRVRGGQVVDGRLVGGDVRERVSENSNGDPRYLLIIHQCMTKRMDLLGHKTTKVEHSGSVGVTVANMDADQIRKEEERILQNMIKKQGVSGNFGESV